MYFSFNELSHANFMPGVPQKKFRKGFGCHRFFLHGSILEIY